MNFGIFEDDGWRNLLPLTWLRPAWALRCGADLLIDKLRAHVCPAIHATWMRRELGGFASRVELDPPSASSSWCLLNGRALWTRETPPPPPGVGWMRQGALVAISLRSGERPPEVETLLDGARLRDFADGYELQPAPEGVTCVQYPWELAHANGAELRRQCRDGGGQRQGTIHPGAHLVCPENIGIGRGSVIKPGVVLDAENGPIRIEDGVVVQANAVLEGPVFVGAGSTIRPHASIRPDVTIGPVCKVGGEIEASIFQGYSNKQHDGFVGHSFVGEWVNLGADTITSDLKNTYGAIRVAINGAPVETGLHFVGSIIGDHSKTGIGTILPTGCVIGVAANVFTQRPVPRFVPSFGWLTDAGLVRYRIEKAVEIARTVMARRDVHLSADDEDALRRVSELASSVEAAGWPTAR